MAFTAEEQAVLCQLSYAKLEVDPNDPETLESMLNKYSNYLEKQLGDNYDDIIAGLKAKVANQDYHVIRTINDDCDSGLVAFAISDPDNNVTVVCQGSEDLTKIATNANSLKDMDTDLQIAFRKETDQQQELEKFLDALQRQGYGSFYFTGHSLGGNLAIHGAVYLGDPDKVLGVTTFNAPGFNAEYFNMHVMKIRQIEGKIVNYENAFDIVSSILHKPGTTVYVESSVDGGLQHSLSELKLRKKGFVRTNGKASWGYVVHSVVHLTDELWKAGILGRYLYAKITGGNITGYRDFSRSALKMMTDAAREVEEESWWRVDRWDCWYRLDKAFGGFTMDYQRLSGDVDTYYRKVIDMNGATVEKIEAIFEKVYGLDNKYAKKISKGTSQLQTQIVQKLTELADSITPNATP